MPSNIGKYHNQFMLNFYTTSKKKTKNLNSKKKTKTSKKMKILNYQATSELYQKSTKIPRTKKIQITTLNIKYITISRQIKNTNFRREAK